MKTLVFFYHDYPAQVRECGDSKTVEQDIRYWLGKSPGIHPIKDIWVIPGEHCDSWLWVIDKMRDEDMAYEEEKRAEAEKREYERLKAKYG